MEEKGNEIEQLKATVISNVRAVLISSKEDINIQQLQSDYYEVVGEKLPFRALGFTSVESFLRSVPTLCLSTLANGNTVVRVLQTDKVDHLVKLIQKQRPSKVKKNVKKPRFNSSSLTTVYKYQGCNLYMYKKPPAKIQRPSVFDRLGPPGTNTNKFMKYNSTPLLQSNINIYNVNNYKINNYNIDDNSPEREVKVKSKIVVPNKSNTSNSLPVNDKPNQFDSKFNSNVDNNKNLPQDFDDSSKSDLSQPSTSSDKQNDIEIQSDDIKEDAAVENINSPSPVQNQLESSNTDNETKTMPTYLYNELYNRAVIPLEEKLIYMKYANIEINNVPLEIYKRMVQDRELNSINTFIDNDQLEPQTNEQEPVKNQEPVKATISNDTNNIDTSSRSSNLAEEQLINSNKSNEATNSTDNVKKNQADVATSINHNTSTEESKIAKIQSSEMDLTPFANLKINDVSPAKEYSLKPPVFSQASNNLPPIKIYEPKFSNISNIVKPNADYKSPEKNKDMEKSFSETSKASTSSEDESDDFSEDNEVKNVLPPNPNYPNHKTILKVYVCCVVDPFKFYIHDNSTAKMLKSMMISLQKFYKSKRNVHSPVRPVLDEIYAFKYEDDLWYRVQVTKILPMSTVKLYFVDFGYKAITLASDLVVLDPQFADIPPSAMCATLSQVLPTTEDGKWPTKTKAAFAELVLDEDFICFIELIRNIDGNKVCVVRLYDVEDTQCNIGLLLIRNRLALPSNSKN